MMCVCSLNSMKQKQETGKIKTKFNEGGVQIKAEAFKQAMNPTKYDKKYIRKKKQ